MATLSETRIRTAKSKERPYKLFDATRPVHARDSRTGGRLWRLRYRIGALEKLISLGAYPDVTLKRAREKRDEARRLIADDIDPSAQRKAQRAALLDTFEGVAQEWLALHSKSLSPETPVDPGRAVEQRPLSHTWAADRWRRSRRKSCWLCFGASRRAAGTKPRTAFEPWRGRVLRYAVATGRAQHDVAADLKDALAPVKSRNFASVTDPTFGWAS
jgi:hypothetical protein